MSDRDEATENDWVICHDGTQGELAYALECLRCGSVQKVATPINIDCYIAMARAYGKQHSRCRPRLT